MIDLKEIERKIDEVLKSETRESLSNWIKEKRMIKVLNSLMEINDYNN